MLLAGEPIEEEWWMNQEEIKRLAATLAPQIIASIRESKHDFWIDPENHFRAHIVMDQFAECLDMETLQTLRDLLKAYRRGRKLFFAAFVGLMIVGALGLVAIAIGMKPPWK